jgi:hypothetical protein
MNEVKAQAIQQSMVVNATIVSEFKDEMTASPEASQDS